MWATGDQCRFASSARSSPRHRRSHRPRLEQARRVRRRVRALALPCARWLSAAVSFSVCVMPPRGTPAPSFPRSCESGRSWQVATEFFGAGELWNGSAEDPTAPVSLHAAPAPAERSATATGSSSRRGRSLIPCLRRSCTARARSVARVGAHQAPSTPSTSTNGADGLGPLLAQGGTAVDATTSPLRRDLGLGRGRRVRRTGDASLDRRSSSWIRPTLPLEAEARGIASAD